ncbi:MAG TPA: glycoside hydrolase family 19 protein [Gemmataceae bacterium]|nr:glycoside hydrolase family 19 protein [Gemmataceae bacterium]
MASITQSVGRGATNHNHSEVELVQQLLNRHRRPPLTQIDEDGLVGTETIKAIEEFQRRVVNMNPPDGRVDPGGATFKALSDNAPGAPASPSGDFAAGLAANGIHNPMAQANASTVLQALKDNGITSKRAQANILAQVNAECGFMPRTEGNYSASTLLKYYGPQQTRNKVRFQTLQDAQAVVNQGPEAVFEKIYGGRMGNTAPGDGYKYRGRGYIQLTGKDNYRRVGAAIGENLVSNPDRANDPKVATKVLLNFLGVSAANQASLENINTVNAKVGPAGSPASRVQFAESILKYL